MSLSHIIPACPDFSRLRKFRLFANDSMILHEFPHPPRACPTGTSKPFDPPDSQHHGASQVALVLGPLVQNVRLPNLQAIHPTWAATECECECEAISSSSMLNHFSPTWNRSDDLDRRWSSFHLVSPAVRSATSLVSCSSPSLETRRGRDGSGLMA